MSLRATHGSCRDIGSRRSRHAPRYSPTPDLEGGFEGGTSNLDDNYVRRATISAEGMKQRVVYVHGGRSNMRWPAASASPRIETARVRDLAAEWFALYVDPVLALRTQTNYR